MPDKITIFIAGDSTAAEKTADRRPETGWGEKLSAFFTDQIVIDNRAINGRSAKSFINEGRLSAIEHTIRPRDYLFIQFGHNDQKDDPVRGTEPYGDYQKNLHTFINTAFKHGAQPVLLTSVSRRHFTDQLIDSMSLGEYPLAMKQFAKTHNIALLDIHKKSMELFQSLGPDLSKNYFLHLEAHESSNYPNGIKDNTHFNEYGAEAIAQLISNALKESDLPLKRFLK
ncbi:rhamnogalacturonan acetylesterase [Niallia circulans]|uniref:Rhamnogalacturonan acetylesterase n=1 Tax=Niallia circulans TaxID=1397 RepID=A0A941GCJ3_NIACI|nr:rhamnogalacturonan acetylesterase [Niallia circulans]MCB5236449.1 rhamnogalacturonan acetylesterase [Niallia circulans]